MKKMAVALAAMALVLPSARAFSVFGASSVLGVRSQQLRAAAPARASRPFLQTVTCQAADKVTGAKFEENDPKKNPQMRGGHGVAGSEIDKPVDPEVARKREIIRLHQEKCPKPTWPEEIRTIMQQKEGFAVLSSNSHKSSLAGFPLASVVGYAIDEQGRPFFSWSGMSAHTQNIRKDGRASLCVTESAFKGAADARVSLVGNVEEVKDKEEADKLRAKYREFHAGAYWADFKDFGIFRMSDVKEVSFVGGFARAGGVTVEEYMAAEPDPLLSFANPVMKHMNDDHTDALKDYVKYLVGVEGDIDKIEMKRLDKLGFDVRVTKGDDSGVLRIPFSEPVTERKGVKAAIVSLSQLVATKKNEMAE